MKTYLINYGYPISQSILVESEDGLTASKTAGAYIKSQGHRLDGVQIVCIGIHGIIKKLSAPEMDDRN